MNKTVEVAAVEKIAGVVAGVVEGVEEVRVAVEEDDEEEDEEEEEDIEEERTTVTLLLGAVNRSIKVEVDDDTGLLDGSVEGTAVAVASSVVVLRPITVNCGLIFPDDPTNAKM